MSDQVQDSRHRIRRTVVTTAWVTAIVGMGLIDIRAKHWNATAQEWAFLGNGVLVAALVVWQIRTGVAYSGVSPYRRGDDPTGFWFAVLVGSVLGVGGIVGSVGALLGLWKF